MPHKLKLLHGMIKMISPKFDGMGVRGRIPCAKKKTDAPTRRVESCVRWAQREAGAASLGIQEQVDGKVYLT